MADWRFGTVTHGTALAGTVSGTILAANLDRKYALLVNDSDTVIYLNFGTAAAVLNKGIRLNANAANQFEMTREKNNVYTGVITGICSAASKTVLITQA